jgi:hypothetical protein
MTVEVDGLIDGTVSNALADASGVEWRELVLNNLEAVRSWARKRDPDQRCPQWCSEHLGMEDDQEAIVLASTARAVRR